MSFLQFNFWVFLLVAITTYYILPKRYQWICLLISSYVFYTYTGIKTIGYILFTTITIWSGSLFISKIEEEKKNDLLANKDSLTSKEKNK
ncbi:hypothetical protein [Clostridium botulinum]|uniref:hypothetical protein n=1 Tax=Clostridium botulinum TaxID=1491 RepID=UPI0002F9F77A|nr:hypothetical protein [Clostridium botulinum]